MNGFKLKFTFKFEKLRLIYVAVYSAHCQVPSHKQTCTPVTKNVAMLLCIINKSNNTVYDDAQQFVGYNVNLNLRIHDN